MEQYGKILTIAMPIFFALAILEALYGRVRGQQTTRNMDMIASMSSGLTMVVKDVLHISITLLSYGWLLRNLAMYQIQGSILTFVVTFIVLDFQGYWTHRWAHKINFFWNKHAIHHSSEDFNLACALRQSVSSFVNVFTFFLIPAAILGVPEKVIQTITPIHLFAQFWYHTRHINKMGFLENILVTPSHHRVHHAMNAEYRDKNFSQIFIIWDKFFGTYQVELTEVPPVYGITRPALTWNPLKINFQHMILMITDAWRTENWKDKLTIWFQPTGWRPADVIVKYPILKVENTAEYQQYDTQNSKAEIVFAWFQILILFILIFYFFGNLGRIGFPSIFYYGIYAFMCIYAYTETMDKNRKSIYYELIKNAYGLGIIYFTNDWFGMNQVFGYASVLLSIYFVFSTLVTAYFAIYTFDKKADFDKVLVQN